MPDQLYAIDAAAASLAPLPAQVPTLVYLPLQTGAMDPGYAPVTLPFTNFTQPQAILYMAGQLSLNGTATVQLDVLINGTSFLSQGSPTTWEVTGSGKTSLPLWAANKANPPIIPAYGSLEVNCLGPYPADGGWFQFALVPQAMLPYAGGL